MVALSNFMKKLKDRRLLNLQILFVLIAFGSMALTTYSIMRRIMLGYLVDNSKNFIASMQAKLESDKKEPKSALDGYVRAMRYMIMSGADVNTLQRFTSGSNGYLIHDTERISNYTGVYGYFKIRGEWTFLHSRGWKPVEDKTIQERPWYKAAMEAKSEIAETKPYYDLSAEEMVFAYSRCFYDDKSNLLGVACISVPLKDFGIYVVARALEQKNSYGVLLDQNLIVIAHENPNFNGRHIGDPIIPLSQFKDKLEAGEDVNGDDDTFTNYKKEPARVFFKKITNGWYIGIVSIINQYEENITKMAWNISIMAALFASALILILILINNAREKAETLNRQKSAFLARMSHEIRTPMNAILGISEIQLEKETLPPDTKEALGKIYNSGSIMLNIINDILDLSKIEAGKMELMHVKYEIASVINDTVQLNMIRFESKPIEFKLKVDETIPSVLSGDELRIKQILNNLLSNAAKYTVKGEVEFSVTKEQLHPNTSDIKLVFSVRDTGVGMTGAQVSKLFDEYSRFNTQANSKTEGTGLGMSITQMLIQMMGGEISVKSWPGKGSVFTVSLPQHVLDPKPLGRDLVENLRQFRMSSVRRNRSVQFVRKQMPHGKILLVDDAQTNLYVARGLMLPYGLNIDTAESGFEAIDKIKSGRVYDIIFMDHMMPEMDGIEATKILRSLGYKNPIVALTANALIGHADVFLANGFDDFLSKPIDTRHLNALLNKYVRDDKAHESNEPKDAEGQQDDYDEMTPQPLDPQLAKVAVRDAEKAIVTLEAICKKRDNLSDEDLNAYVVSVHAMKSVLMNIGETALSDIALQLETAGKNRDITVVSSNTPLFLNALRMVVEKIKSM